MNNSQDNGGTSAAAAAGAEEPHEEVPPQGETQTPSLQALLRALSTQQATIADLQKQIQLLSQPKEEKPKDNTQMNQIAYFVHKFKDDLPRFNALKSQKDVTYWDSYWDRIASFKLMTSCGDDTIAYLIKLTAEHR